MLGCITERGPADALVVNAKNSDHKLETALKGRLWAQAP